MPGLAVSLFYHIAKTLLQGTSLFLRSIQSLPFLQEFIQDTSQRGSVFIITSIQIQMQDRIYLPVFLQPFHRQPLEQLPLSLEIGLQRR